MGVSPAICTHNARILAASGDLDSHDPPAAAGRRWGSEISERPLLVPASDLPVPGPRPQAKDRQAGLVPATATQLAVAFKFRMMDFCQWLIQASIPGSPASESPS